MIRALALLLVLCACREASGVEERSLAQLERLTFVPPGECVLARPNRAGLDCSTARALLVDRYEVTRAEWLAWLERGAGGAALSAREFRARWGAGGEDWPATWMSLPEARRYAAAQRMRLLTAREWMRVAAGTRAQRLPWGAPARSVANTLELGLGRLAPVGTFENGRTSLGVYDLIGNASEWVEGTLLELDPTSGDRRTFAAGGSYLGRMRELFVPEVREPGGLRFNAELLDPDHRGIDLGLRVGADAEEYLRALPPSLARSELARARLRAVGERWGPAAVPLLESLAREPGAPPAIASLLRGARR